MKIIKRKLITPKKNSKQSLNLLIIEKKLENKLISTYEMNNKFKHKLSDMRNKTDEKHRLIFPKIKYHSQSDPSNKYPYFLYLIEDIERYSKFLNLGWK